MPDTTGGKADWSSLPEEIRLKIFEALAQSGRGASEATDSFAKLSQREEATARRAAALPWVRNLISLSRFEDIMAIPKRNEARTALEDFFKDERNARLIADTPELRAKAEALWRHSTITDRVLAAQADLYDSVGDLSSLHSTEGLREDHCITDHAGFDKMVLQKWREFDNHLRERRLAQIDEPQFLHDLADRARRQYNSPSIEQSREEYDNYLKILKDESRMKSRRTFEEIKKYSPHEWDHLQSAPVDIQIKIAELGEYIWIDNRIDTVKLQLLERGISLRASTICQNHCLEDPEIRERVTKECAEIYLNHLQETHGWTRAELYRELTPFDKAYINERFDLCPPFERAPNHVRLYAQRFERSDAYRTEQQTPIEAQHLGDAREARPSSSLVRVPLEGSSIEQSKDDMDAISAVLAVKSRYQAWGILSELVDQRPHLKPLMDSERLPEEFKAQIEALRRHPEINDRIEAAEMDLTDRNGTAAELRKAHVISEDDAGDYDFMVLRCWRRQKDQLRREAERGWWSPAKEERERERLDCPGMARDDEQDFEESKALYDRIRLENRVEASRMLAKFDDGSDDSYFEWKNAPPRMLAQMAALKRHPTLESRIDAAKVDLLEGPKPASQLRIEHCIDDPEAFDKAVLYCFSRYLAARGIDADRDLQKLPLRDMGHIVHRFDTPSVLKKFENILDREALKNLTEDDNRRHREYLDYLHGGGQFDAVADEAHRDSLRSSFARQDQDRPIMVTYAGNGAPLTSDYPCRVIEIELEGGICLSAKAPREGLRPLPSEPDRGRGAGARQVPVRNRTRTSSR